MCKILLHDKTTTNNDGYSIFSPMWLKTSLGSQHPDIKMWLCSCGKLCKRVCMRVCMGRYAEVV